MSYVFGLGSTSTVPFVSTPTLEGDGFQSLYAAYKSAFPAGTTLTDFTKAICRANGVTYSVPAIEAWIFGLSGKRYPFISSNNPGMYNGPKNVGWSFFGAGNKIMLPDIPRPGLTPPAPTPVIPPPAVEAAEAGGGPSPVLLIAAGLVIFGLLGGRKKSDGAALKT